MKNSSHRNTEEMSLIVSQRFGNETPANLLSRKMKINENLFNFDLEMRELCNIAL